MSKYDLNWNHLADYNILNTSNQDLEWYNDKLWVSRSGGERNMCVYEYVNDKFIFAEALTKTNHELENAQGFTFLGDNLYWTTFTEFAGITHNKLCKFSISYQEKDAPDYGVLSWWDYGHWIIRIGHRVPLASPAHQGEPWHSQFLAAQTEEAANSMLESLNIRYVILDRAETTSKFYAIVRKAELSESITEQLRPNSMAVRLWSEQTITWKKIYGSGDVKIFERR